MATLSGCHKQTQIQAIIPSSPQNNDFEGCKSAHFGHGHQATEWAIFNLTLQVGITSPHLLQQSLKDPSHNSAGAQQPTISQPAHQKQPPICELCCRAVAEPSILKQIRKPPVELKASLKHIFCSQARHKASYVWRNSHSLTL